jgi:hypothetical protein
MMAKNRRTDDSAEYPKRAAWLSIIPALGAIYNGQYIKAVTHFAVFAALCIMSDDVHEIFGWGALTFYCYMFIESYRSAQQLREQRLAASTADTPLTSEDVRSPFWGILLILLGIVFTLHNLNIISFFLIRRFWPIVFILVGGYLLYRYTVGRADRKSTLLPF